MVSDATGRRRRGQGGAANQRTQLDSLFGSAIALLALYAVVLTAVTLTIERERDVSA